MDEDFSFLADLPKQSTLLPETLFKTTENLKNLWKTSTASKSISCVYDNWASFGGETETTKKRWRKWRKTWSSKKIPVVVNEEESLTIKNSESSQFSVDEFDFWKYINDLKDIIESKGSIPESLITILGMKKIVDLITLLLKD